MKAISLRKMVIAVLIIGAGTSYVCADMQELQAKLSKEATFEFKDVTIAQALENIGQKAEVKIVLSDEAVWKLPFGEATRLSASLSGPLADSLSKMLSGLFMRYAVGYDKITIYPRQELEHIIGRPTARQIILLKHLYIDRIRSEEQTSDEVLQRILMEFDVVIVPIECNEELGLIIERSLVERSLRPTFAQMLDSIGEKWYISGVSFPGTVTEIRVVDEEDFREAKLDQVVDVSFDDRADVIIKRLAGWAGMELDVYRKDPSWLEERINVDMQNMKLRQALRNIVSSVDGEISCDVPSNEIYIEGPIHRAREKEAASAKPKTGGSAGEGYVGKISIPMDGGKYFIEFMLRESDLTEELRKLREEKIKEIFEKVSKAGDNAPEIVVRSQAYSILN
ncbi:MAG: hypothetical protein ACXACF_05350 [Candidatus Hermodarchaeia archaeon]|jgi:hypothetical protein